MTHDESVPLGIHAFTKRPSGKVFSHGSRGAAERSLVQGQHENRQTCRRQRWRSDCDSVPVVLDLGGTRWTTPYTSFQFLGLSSDDEEFFRGIEQG